MSLLALLLTPADSTQPEISRARAMPYRETPFIYSVLRDQGMEMNEDHLWKLASRIAEESRKYSFDPALILAIIKVESQFDHNAVSHRGARGLMQVRTTAAAALVERGAIADVPDGKKLKDPYINVKIGTAYLHHLTEIFQDLRLALTAYHSGPTRVKKQLAAKEPIQFVYAGKVLSARRAISLQASLPATSVSVSDGSRRCFCESASS